MSEKSYSDSSNSDNNFTVEIGQEAISPSSVVISEDISFGTTGQESATRQLESTSSTSGNSYSDPKLSDREEHLQAVIAELKASNEKLQAANQKLHLVNVRYQSQIDQLTELSSNIYNLLKSTDIAVIFLDRQLRIRKFTPAAARFVSLQDIDMHRPIAELSLKIQCPNLIYLLQEVLETKQPKELEVELASANICFLMQINLYQAQDNFGQGLVISFVNLDEIREVRYRLEQEIISRKLAQKQLQQANLVLEQRVGERTKSLVNFKDRLKKLHSLAIANYQHPDHLFASYLEVGCQILNLSTGIVAQIEGDICEVVAVKSPLDLTRGDRISGSHTYCQKIIETNTTVSLKDLEIIESSHAHPAYFHFPLKSLIGTPIVVNGNPYGTLNFSDTTPRKSEFAQEEKEIVEMMAKDLGNYIAAFQLAEALRNTEILFRNTFEQAAVGMAHISSTDAFLRVNQRFCDILGYSSDRLRKLTLKEITHPEDVETDLEQVERLMAKKIRSYSIEKRYLNARGSTVWVNLTVSLVPQPAGESDYRIAVIEDISERQAALRERKQTEIALQESRQQLQKVNQAKDRFIAHMSHELRTPLNSILGFSDILQKNSTLPPQQLNFLKTINRSGKHLLTLINDILDLSKLAVNELQLNQTATNLSQLLEETIAIFEIQAQQKNLHFISDISPSLPEFATLDSKRLRQVLFNLLSNAIKFTSSGSVTFKVYPVSQIAKDDENSVVRFAIEDMGIGIPREQFANIFNPFEQLRQNNPNCEGTGLGLAICQNIVQLMGSQIKLESTVGKGSKFWFDLKLEKTAGSNSSSLSEFDSSTSAKLRTPCKILVIDDKQDNRALLVNYLQPLGFTVAEAENGQIGLNLAQTFAPDAILVDLIMPMMDGKETISQIRQQSGLEDVIVILISASSDLKDCPSVPNCHGVLSKPIDLDRLLQLLENNLHLNILVKAKEPMSELSAFVAPPKAELRKLLELAKFGNIQGIEEQINYLESQDPKYVPMMEKIRELAINCQQYQLESFVRQYI